MMELADKGSRRIKHNLCYKISLNGVKGRIHPKDAMTGELENPVIENSQTEVQGLKKV